MKKIFWLDDIKDEKINVIRTSEQGSVYGPRFHYSNCTTRIVNVPEVALYQFENGIVRSDSSHIIFEDIVIMERIKGVGDSFANYSSGSILQHNSTKAITFECPTVEFEAGFFLGGNGSWNYYHWLYEIFPKIQYLIELNIYKKVKIFLSIAVRDTDSFSYMLSKAFYGHEVEFLFMEKNISYKLKKLTYINSPNNLVFNTRGKVSNLEHCFFRTETLLYIKSCFKIEHYIDSFSLAKIYPKKIFLARKAGSARKYNQCEVFSVLVSYGFESIYMEDLSFVEQVSYFNNAQIIIGPSGAAWSNVIFCSSNTRAISWISDAVGDFPAFSTLAALTGVEMEFLKVISHNDNDFHGSYVVDLSSLKSILNFDFNSEIL